MKHILAPLPVLAAIAMLASGPIAPPAAAQQAHEPVILVNDRPITPFELEQRALLLRALGAGGDPLPLAREALIDDRLRMYAADRAGIQLGPNALDQGLAEFAGQRNLEPEQVLLGLQERGIAEETLLDFLEASLTWRELVRVRFADGARPTDRDLDIALDFASRAVEESVLLQEIAIPVEDIGDTQTTELAERLSRQLNRGGNFDSAVAQYSRAPSARNGGRLDWVEARQLPAAVAGQVLALMPGEVTAPIPFGPAVLIFKLRDIREVPRPAEIAPADTVTYFELVQTLTEDAPEAAVMAANSLARSVRRETTLCTDLDGRVAEFAAGSGRSEPTPVNQLPATVAPRLAAMQPGDIEIFRDPRGVVLLMLCARAGEASPEEREALRRRLFNERMNTFATAYLRQLRGDAVIIEK